MTCEPKPPLLHPAKFIVTPSKAPSPWIGTWAQGARYSHEQLHAMVVRGLNPETAEAIRVRRPASSAETYWARDTHPPVHEYDCPILKRRSDGRLDVLGPAGITALVLADGWVRHLKELKGWGRLSA
jgi:hypothetical protein